MSHPLEFYAVILAATVGGRLFPLTSKESPKHVLPIAGVAVLTRLLDALEASGFRQTVIAVSQDDSATVDLLRQACVESSCTTNTASEDTTVSLLYGTKLHVTVVRLEPDCPGSVQALRQVERCNLIPPSSNVVVLPGDAVILDATALADLCHLHRTNTQTSYPTTACTLLLTDVGEIDDATGAPLKESAKHKKGGYARDNQDIHYIALATDTNRVVWMQSKMDVETDHDQVGSTPKVIVPKPRLRTGATTRIRTDWQDVHVYVLSPWVRQLVIKRTSLHSMQENLLPLLISRQFQGVAATFGSNTEEVFEPSPLNETATAFEELLRGNGSLQQSPRSSISNSISDEYCVSAVVQKKVLRAHSIAAYLHASKELTHVICAAADPKSNVPKETMVNGKFSSLILPETTVGNKVTCKGSVVGRRCRLGANCRINNCLIMDNVTIGDNTILQNSIVGPHCTIGENCNLNDCQVGPYEAIPAGSKEKGESFFVDTNNESLEE
jgi:translation initiation factor eIF-2B subunit gamma